MNLIFNKETSMYEETLSRATTCHACKKPLNAGETVAYDFGLFLDKISYCPEANCYKQYQDYERFLDKLEALENDLTLAPLPFEAWAPPLR